MDSISQDGSLHEIKILKRYSEYKDYDRYIDQVSHFADQNKKSFGFMPATAYRQMSLKGQLWLAVNKENHIYGYLMFGGVYPNLRVFQLFVAPHARGQGIGKILLDELVSHGNKNKYAFIHAKVAAELPANQFWEKSGFSITHTSQGGSENSKTRRLVNHRLLQLDTPDLLTQLFSENKSSLEYSNKPTLSPSIYSLDLNVIFDLVRDRNNTAVARDLITKSINGAVKVVLTRELVAELERTKVDEEDPLLALAKALPVLPSFEEEKVVSLSEELRKIVFPQRSLTGKKAINDLSDLRHLAFSILAKIDGFITGEGALLANSDELSGKYGIEVISPAEFIYQPSNISLEPTQINGDAIEVTSCMNVLELRTIPLISALRVSDNVVSLIENNLKTNKDFEAYDLRIDGKIVAYCGIDCANSYQVMNLYLFVDESHPQASLAIDHFLERSFRKLPNDKVCRINLEISPSQTITIETAIAKGFVKTPHASSLIKISFNGIIDEGNWQMFASKFHDESGYSASETFPSSADIANTGITLKGVNDVYARIFTLFEFESLISPGFLNHSARTCTLIPIKQTYADELLGTSGAQANLFCLKPNLLMLEKAYFRSTARAHYLCKGELVAFYVSGKISSQEIIGIARVTYSEIRAVDEIGASLSRQGVIEKAELSNAADKHGNIHVFTFDNFKKLPFPIGFTRAKELGLISAANLATIEKLENDKLSLLLKTGYSE